MSDVKKEEFKEKVIEGLQCHIKRKVDIAYCNRCPYRNNSECSSDLLKDATKLAEDTLAAQGRSYRDGLKDAWNVARKLFEVGDNALTTHELKECFGHVSERDVLKYLDAETAVEKLKQYDAGFKYGAIVKNRMTGNKAIVLSSGGKIFSGMTKTGPFLAASVKEWEDTGETVDLLTVIDKL